MNVPVYRPRPTRRTVERAYGVEPGASIPGTTAAPLVQLGQGKTPAPVPVSVKGESPLWWWAVLAMLVTTSMALGGMLALRLVAVKP